MALPVVGAKQLNLARLTPEVRKILRQRARGEARREWAPILAADRAAFAAPQAAYQTQAAATRGAAAMSEDLLTSALAGLRAKGLQGSALRQTQSELTSRIGDASAAVPFLLADAAEERATGISEARQQLLQHRAEMQQDAAAGFNSALSSARDDAQDAVKAQRAKEAEASTGADDELSLSPEALKNAELALKLALKEWGKNPEVEVDGGGTARLKELNPLRTDEDWLRFEKQLVDNFDGFGMAAINAVIERIRPKAADARKRREHQGALPQPGVPGAGTWAARP